MLASVQYNGVFLPDILLTVYVPDATTIIGEPMISHEQCLSFQRLCSDMIDVLTVPPPHE